jgi:hypothetical protein
MLKPWFAQNIRVVLWLVGDSGRAILAILGARLKMNSSDRADGNRASRQNYETGAGEFPVAEHRCIRSQLMRAGDERKKRERHKARVILLFIIFPLPH